MGGCKCTYRNCSVKSDGKSHMFHYPVFDKVRCHQWLTNAQRLDFLNLKVSQLRNRVVCQHHFKPESFMNYKMDKLRNDAVPTENGPFCNVKDLPKKLEPLPICPEEIENELLTFREKKANFSVKYGDFLVNSEIDIDKLSLLTQQEPNLEKPKSEVHIPPVTETKQYPVQNAIEIEVPSNMALITTTHKPQAKNKVHIISEKKISTPVALTGKLEPVSTNTIIYPRRTKPEPMEPVQVIENIENMNVVFHNPNDNTVDLANSEITFYPQTLIEPANLQVVSINQPVSYSPVIQNYDPSGALAQIEIFNPPTRSQTMLTPVDLPSNIPVESTPLKNKNNQFNKPTNRYSPKSLLKNKIPPERIAAIEQKRKFNKKLRDMIEFCLDDSPEKCTKDNSLTNNKIENKPEINTLKIIEELKKPMEVKRMASTVKDIMNESSKKKVSSFLSEEPKLPSISEYTLASIEARLQRMEENLSHRIEQNAQKINELKDVTHKATSQNKSIMTQTKEDEDTCKKQLYMEISKFLSPEANSMVYEELFLNKYSKKPVEKAVGHSKKRRKY